MLAVWVPATLWAQTELESDTPFVVDYNYTLPDFIVEAQQDSNYEKNLRRLVYNVKKVLPYAKMASFRFQMMEQNLQVLPSEKARKEYSKLNKEFQDSTNTSKKLADVWKEVAKTIVQELN
jgi:hypothetical protein